MRSRVGVIAAVMLAPSIANAANAVTDATFVAWARTTAVALPVSARCDDVVSQDSLHPIVGNARVVALGEPAHGAHEPLAFRNRLFRSLVEHHGYTAIALESGLSESRRAHDFVTGGPRVAEQVARDSLTWGFGEYVENVELLQWIRQYNAEPTRRRKVNLYGFDLSGGDGKGQLPGARIALDHALTYLSRFAADSSRAAREAVEPFRRRFTHEAYLVLSPAERVGLSASINGLIGVLERERVALTAASTESDYEWALRNAVVARQLEELFRLWPADTPGDAVSPQFYRAASSRDASMAENVQWILRREGPSGRVLVFAHNAHVMGVAVRGGLLSVYPEPPTTLGQRLRSSFGKDLLVIGAGSASNGPGLPSATQGQGSLDGALGRVGIPHFIVDLRGARGDEGASAWLGQVQSLRANYATELLLPPREAFDALVFIRELTPAGRRCQAH